MYTLEEKETDDLKKLMKKEQFETPWCTIVMVLMIFVCHTLVLVGNMQTAGGIGSIGASTGGWSGVGTNLGDAIHHELDVGLKNITSMLSEAINMTLGVQKTLDVVIGLAGHITNANHTGNATKAMMLLQAHGMAHVLQVPPGLPAMVAGDVDQIMDKLMAFVIKGVKELMANLKPVLLLIGKFIIKFGAKIQQVIQQFSITLDRVQKIFDAVMSSLAKKGDTLDNLFYNTWFTFNPYDHPAINATDIQHVGHLYQIPALQGSVAEDMVKKYGSFKKSMNATGVDYEEYKKMVFDKSVPQMMDVILRSFATSLGKVAGKLESAKFRSEIANDLADYFNLMVAKNHTKVQWVCDAMGNGSLPLAFVADSFIAMALQLDDPNHFFFVKSGKYVMTQSMKLHPKTISKAIDMISNASFFVTEGYDPKDHPIVVKRVTHWMVEAQDEIKLLKKEKAAVKLLETGGIEEASALLEKDSWEDTPSMLMEKKVVDGLPDLAYKMAEENMRVYLAEQEEKERGVHDELFETDTSKLLLLHLQDGQKAYQASTGHVSPATQMISGGIPALPQTLRFAKYLSDNATDCSKRFAGYVFAYSKQSSSQMDSFAAEVQGMVKKVQAFISMMMHYSTPQGINLIEEAVDNFATHAATDILKLVKSNVNKVIIKGAPMLTKAINQALKSAADALGRSMVGVISSPLGQALAPALEGILRTLVGKKAGDKIGKDITGTLTKSLTDATGDTLGEPIYKMLKDLVNKALGVVGKAVNNAAHSSWSLLEMPTTHVLQPLDLSALEISNVDLAQLADIEKELGSALRACQIAVKDEVERRLKLQAEGKDTGTPDYSEPDASLLQSENDLAADMEDDSMSTTGAWNNMVQTLKTLTNVVPQANKALVDARKEVAQLAKHLTSIFSQFHANGPPIFDKVSSLWSVIWGLYYALVISFPLTIGYYAFWAGGYFKGAGTVDVDDPPEPATFGEKCYACWHSCCNCMCGCHDLTACFWGGLVGCQIIALLLFVIAIVFCILAGIKIFISSGCAEIYLIGDPNVCGTSLGGLRKFLDTFLPGVLIQDLAGMCTKQQLLTCHMIGNEMFTSGILCVIGAFGAAILTFQLLIEVAHTHTRAVARREIANVLYDRNKKEGLDGEDKQD